MLPVFQTKATVVRPTSISSHWGYARRQLQAVYERAISYRQQYWLESQPRNEFLMKLVKNYPLSFDLPIDEFVDAAYWEGLNFSQTMGMTSSISSGKAHFSNFLGGSSIEFYLATFESFDYEAAAQNWRNISSIKYLTHPRSSLAAAPECHQSGENGIVVLSINLPLLAVQLRGFILEARDVELNTKVFSSFIDQYVLPNAICSQAEVALLNQLMYLQDNELIFRSTQTAKTPYPNVNVDNEVLSVVEETLKSYEQTDWLFDSLLQATPSIYYKNARVSMMLPDVQVSPNSVWVMVLARIRIYDFFLRSFPECRNANQAEINRINRTIQAYNVASSIRKHVPQPEQSSLLEMIKRIEALV